MNSRKQHCRIALTTLLICGFFAGIKDAHSYPNVAPSPKPSAIPTLNADETPAPSETKASYLFDPPLPSEKKEKDSVVEKAIKNAVNKRACFGFVALSNIVLNNPEASKLLCEFVAQKEYEKCLKENPGDPPTKLDYTSRPFRPCRSHRNLTLEGCEILPYFAKDMIAACEKNMVTVFPDEEGDRHPDDPLAN